MSQDEEGLLAKLRNRARNSGPSFSAHEVASNAWRDLEDALRAIKDAIRSAWKATP